LKLNGQLRGYSDLSRVVELESLCAGVDAKRSLWISLKALQGSDSRLSEFDFDALESRARRQREELEEHRRAAAAAAFQGSDIATGR
jgi:hypothetical protein